MFSLNESQTLKVKEWVTEKLKDKAYTGAAGGRFEYRFCPTGLGTCVQVHDFITKEHIDITDYSDW